MEIEQGGTCGDHLTATWARSRGPMRHRSWPRELRSLPRSHRWSRQRPTWSALNGRARHPSPPQTGPVQSRP
eukprot:6763165-Prymnesium_polylepis.1